MSAHVHTPHALRFTTALRLAVIAMAFPSVSTLLHAGPPIGINVGSPYDFSGENMFADAIKQSRYWDTTNLDSRGWPNQDSVLIVWGTLNNVWDTSGTYALSFKGQGVAKYSSSPSGPWTTIATTYANGVTSGSFNIGYLDSLYLQFTQTVKATGGAGVSDVKLMRPTSVGATTSYSASTTFTTQAKSLYSKFSVLRFMDFTNTNANPCVNWSDRNRPDRASQFRYQGAFWNSPQLGAAWEYAVMLANETGKDLWVNVPVSATNDYITKLAQLIRYGSNGDLPYTTSQSSPVYPPLDSSRKIYVEFSNEVWNDGAPFPQSATNRNLAIQEVNQGGSPLNFDGSPNQYEWAARRIAKRTKEISDIFRTIFPTEMMTRVRPVLETQADWPELWLYQATHMLEDYYNNPARVSSPQPPSYYVYGGGGSAYYSPQNDDPNLTINNIWTSHTFNSANWLPRCIQNSAYALGIFGRRIAYEGGPGLDKFDSPQSGPLGPIDSVKSQAWSDSRMTTLMTDKQTVWQQTGGDLLVYFTAVGDFQWGFARNVNTLSSRKLTAVDQISASTPTTGNIGTAIPGTISGSAFQAPETYYVNRNALTTTGANATWLSYLVNVSSASAFNVSLNAGSVGAGNQAELYVDGAYMGTVSIPNTGSNTTYAATGTVTTMPMSVGTHAIKVKAIAGTFGVGSVVANASSGGGGAKVITSIRFYPRPGSYAWRMQGGRFEASNNNSTWTTLYSMVNVWPADNTWTTLPISNSTAWRYVRFVSSNVNTYDALNVAEIEFYNGSTKLTGTGIGTTGSYQNNPAWTFDKALDGNINTYVDNSGGSWVGYDFGP